MSTAGPEMRQAEKAADEGQNPVVPSFGRWRPMLKPSVWMSMVAVLFLCVNLWNIGEYGISADEHLVMRRGQEADTLFRAALTGKQIDYNLQYRTTQLYPNFYCFLNYRTAEFLKGRGMDAVAAGHVLNVLVAAMGLVFLFLLASRLFNQTIALWATLFLALLPRFVAHAHYNAKDMPVMALSVMALYLMCLAWQTQRRLWWAVAGVGFGVALGAKLDALLALLAFATTVLVVFITRKERPSTQQWLNAGVFAYAALITVFLTWPLLWIDPFLHFKAIHHFSGEFTHFHVWYLGHRYPIGEAPWHYMPLHLIATSPLPFLGFTIAGTVMLTRSSLSQERVVATSLIFLLIAYPLLARLFPGAVQYGGMRHVFLAVPGLAVLAGIGFAGLLASIPRRPWRPALQAAMAVSVFGWLLWENVRIHPLQGHYLNQGVRAIVPPERLAKSFHFYGWHTYWIHGAKWLNKHALDGAVVHVTDRRHAFARHSLRPDIVITNSGPADLIVFPGTREDYVSRYSGTPEFALQCYGANLLLIHIHAEPRSESAGAD